MSQINKIKMLTEMLFENIELLEDYPEKVAEWKEKCDKYKEEHGKNYYYNEPYPTQGTSQSHIRDIARLLRKELLKL